LAADIGEITMNGEFTRKELYDLVWSQPMKTVAAGVGISDVALAKKCRKANIPVPNRGYWARKQAGKPTIQIALPPRFPGASDRIGGSRQHFYYGLDWAEEFRKVSIPPGPTFDEEMTSVEKRARTLIGKVRCLRKFEPPHPLVAKLLAHDEERRQEFSKWRSSYFAPKYDAGTERRRLLIINTLFVTASRLGCRASMGTSKYGQDAGSERDIVITFGESHVHFTVESVISKEQKQERLRLAFGMARERASASKFWEDSDEASLDDQLADVLVAMLVSAETSYRDGLVRNRDWIIERKAAAEAELKKRQEEAEREARELQQKLARQRIAHLFAQTKAFDRANQIRAYVESALLRVTETSIGRADFDRWVVWARQEADRTDPVKNGMIAEAIRQHVPRAPSNDQPVSE
jgi:hypothetical protein